MAKRVAVLALIAVAVLGLGVGGARAERPGERSYRYQLTAMGARAGEAVLQVGLPELVGKTVLRALKLDARTDGLAASFLNVESLSTTWVDASWIPVRSRWDMVVDGIKRVVKGTFEGRAVTGIDERDGKLFEKNELRANDPPLDLVSMFGWLMNQDLSPGTKYVVPVFDGRRIYMVALSVGVAKEIQVPIGFRRGIPVKAVVTREGYKREVELWLSADKDRAPLRMVFKYGVLGTVEAELIAEKKV